MPSPSAGGLLPRGPRPLLSTRFGQLPPGVDLAPGEVRIAFFGTADFLQKFRRGLRPPQRLQEDRGVYRKGFGFVWEAVPRGMTKRCLEIF
jgi:hypothetical protein